MCAVHFSVIHVIPNSVNVSGEMRGVGRQAGTRKATAPPHVQESWQEEDSWLRLCRRQPGQEGEDGVA